MYFFRFILPAYSLRKIWKVNLLSSFFCFLEIFLRGDFQWPIYSKTCLKPTPTGPENLSALVRCPPYRGYVRFEQYDRCVGNLDIHTSSRSL